MSSQNTVRIDPQPKLNDALLLKVVTILGTRPEIIRLSRIIEKLDANCTHLLVHTGQNYDPELNDVFFRELGVRKPDHYLGARGSFGEQIAIIMREIERILIETNPDKFLVLGDTNSSLAAIVAKRLAIPVYHMEAGNRCFDDRVPEEVNRRLIDHSSDILLPYTERSRQNLVREGIHPRRIYVTGNPINEVISHFSWAIENSTILGELGIREQHYFLVTLHRAENVDVESRLRGLVNGLELIQHQYGLPVIVSTHPRTRARLGSFGIASDTPMIRYLPPFGFFDFVHLERRARCVLSDSGTVQEECAIMGVPNVTIRDVTERPETIEAGSNILSGADPDSVARCVRLVLEMKSRWQPPTEYLTENVSDIVVKLLLGFHHS